MSRAVIKGQTKDSFWSSRMGTNCVKAKKKKEGKKKKKNVIEIQYNCPNK